MHTHVHVHTCKHGPAGSHLPNSRAPQNMWDGGEGPGPGMSPSRAPPPWERRREPSQSSGPSEPGPGPGRAGRKQDAAQEGWAVGKGAGPAGHCPQQNCVRSTAPGAPGLESNPVDNRPESPRRHGGARSGRTAWELVLTPKLPKPGHYPGPEVSVPEGRSLQAARVLPPAGPQCSPEGDPGWPLASVLSQVNALSSAGKWDSNASVSSIIVLGGGGAGAGRNGVHPDPLGPG